MLRGLQQILRMNNKVLLAGCIPLILDHMFPRGHTDSILGRTFENKEFILFIPEHNSNMI